MLTVGVTLIVAAGNLTVSIGGMLMGGIFLSSFVAIVTFNLLAFCQSKFAKKTPYSDQ